MVDPLSAAWFSNIVANGLPWATSAVAEVAPALPTFMQPAANFAMPFINPATVAGAETAAASLAPEAAAALAPEAAAALAPEAAAAAGGVGAAGTAAAVVGSGIAGALAGWGIAELGDMTKGNLFGQDKWGNDQSSWDFLADSAVGVNNSVTGFTSQYLGKDVGGALGTAAGIGTTLVGALPTAYAGLADTGMSALGSAASWASGLFD